EELVIRRLIGAVVAADPDYSGFNVTAVDLREQMQLIDERMGPPPPRPREVPALRERARTVAGPVVARSIVGALRGVFAQMFSDTPADTVDPNDPTNGAQDDGQSTDPPVPDDTPAQDGAGAPEPQAPEEKPADETSGEGADVSP